MELEFDEATHTYATGGRKLPSVTGIISDVGFIDDSFFDKRSRDRGTFVHQACEMFDMGILDEETLDPVLVGYVNAYKNFRAAMPISWDEIEQPRHDAALGFAGTPDRVVRNKMVLDLKTSKATQPWWGVQLAAYAMLAFTAGASTLVKRYSLRLRDDGTYKLDEHNNKRDFEVFRSAVVIYNAKRGMV